MPYKDQVHKCTGREMTPFYVIGDAEFVIGQLLATSKGLQSINITRNDIKVKKVDEIHLDPGGMLMLEPIKDFEALGVKFSLRPHKSLDLLTLLGRAVERVEGYRRIPQGPSSCSYFVYMREDMIKSLDLHLSAMEFEDGTKEARDKSNAARDKAFEEGHLARPHGNGYVVVKQDEPE